MDMETATPSRIAHCKRRPAGTTPDQLRLDHKARMQQRRVGQRSRQPGFTPVRNARVDSAIALEELLITQATLASGGSVDPAAVRDQAIRNVARQLPKAAPSKLYRARPSKSDNPEYRKATA